jgi:hypothetical protein
MAGQFLVMYTYLSTVMAVFMKREKEFKSIANVALTMVIRDTY